MPRGKINDRPFPNKRSMTDFDNPPEGKCQIESNRVPIDEFREQPFQVIGEISAKAETVALGFTTEKSKLKTPMSGVRGCVDTGAPKTVCGIHTAKTLCKMLKIPFRLGKSVLAFKFADQTSASLGCLLVPVRTPVGMRSLQVEIVDADIPLLIGLDFMDHMRVTATL
jgi:hypothetical protein